jgi:hypothetical protein
MDSVGVQSVHGPTYKIGAVSTLSNSLSMIHEQRSARGGSLENSYRSIGHGDSLELSRIGGSQSVMDSNIMIAKALVKDMIRNKKEEAVQSNMIR